MLSIGYFLEGAAVLRQILQILEEITWQTQDQDSKSTDCYTLFYQAYTIFCAFISLTWMSFPVCMRTYVRLVLPDFPLH